MRAPLLTVLALLVATSGASAQRPNLGLRARAAESLNRVNAPADVARSVAEIAEFGLPILPELLGILFEDTATLPGGQALQLDDLRRAALYSAFAALPHNELVLHLERVARESTSDEEREKSLELLERVGTGAEVRLFFALANPGGSEPPSLLLRDRLEQALLALAQRDAAIPTALVRLYPRTSGPDRATIIEMLGQTHSEEAPGLLAGLLGTAGVEADTMILVELVRLGSDSNPFTDSAALEKVRGFLGHPDPRLSTLACLAVEKLRDSEAVPELIALLGTGDPGLQARAHQTLRRLTGFDLGRSAEPWMEWLDRSLAWWEERESVCEQQLASGTAAEAVAALEEVAVQRLYPEHVVPLVSIAAERSEPEVRKLACRALSAMRHPAASAELVRLATSSDPEVAAEARPFLQSLMRSSVRPAPHRLRIPSPD